MIVCFHLTVRHPVQDDSYLFNDVSFEIGESSWTEIVGPAGSGKSVLFSILSLRAVAPKGQVLIAGRNVERLRAKRLAQLRQQVGSCKQPPQLLESRTVIENLILPLVVRGQADKAVQAAENLLKQIACEHLRDRPVNQLSTHDKALVGILMAIIGGPKLILIDGGLDGIEPELQTGITALCMEYKAQGSAVVLFGRKRSRECPDDGQEYQLIDGQLSAIEWQEPQVRQLSQVREVV